MPSQNASVAREVPATRALCLDSDSQLEHAIRIGDTFDQRGRQVQEEVICGGGGKKATWLSTSQEGCIILTANRGGQDDASGLANDGAASLTEEPAASARVVIAAAGGNQKTPPVQDKPASQPQSSPDNEDTAPPGQTKDPGENPGQGSGSNPNNGNGPDRTDRAVPPGLLDKLASAETQQVTPNYILPVRGWVEYQYDAVGNRVRESSDAGSKEFTYDAANRLLQAGEVAYDYDVAGNMVTRHDPELGLVSYDYDVAGRLRQVSYEDETGVSYGYDAFGRKVSRTATFWSVNERGPSEQGLANGKGHEQGRHSGSEMGWVTSAPSPIAWDR